MFWRGGFLFTLAAAAVGAATFDPKSLLWVPTVQPIVPELTGTSAAAVIAGAEDAGACGIGMSDQAPWGLVMRVRTAGSVSTYLIDRWD
jgi:hypothetical protein